MTTALARRGTSNANVRGSAADRRARRAWLLNTFGDGVTCECYRCGVRVDDSTLTVDRIVPGCMGGRYVRDNIRPACGYCNSETGARLNNLMPPTEHPRAVKTMLNKFGVGWRHRVVYGTGEMTFGGLSEETDGDGKRKRVSSVEPVESVSIRARHPDGRSMAAVWVKRASKSWAFDMGYRWTCSPEGFPNSPPKAVKSTELSDYIKDQT